MAHFSFLEFVVLVCFTIGNAVPANQMAGLELLYNSTNGGNWTWEANSTHWNFETGANPCLDAWQGISCNKNCVKNASTCVVLEISLKQNNMRGTIPSQLPLLMPELVSLELIDNVLFGKIPTTIGVMQSLSTLRLYNNHLANSIPSEIGNMSSLVELMLYLNHLNSTIPAELSQLSYLQDIMLTGNELTGCIPTQIALISSLVHLDLDGNCFDGTIPSIIGQLYKLERLLISDNGFSGILPIELGNLTSLNSFVGFNNLLSGTIPTTFGQLNDLTTFEFFHNSLIGIVPTAIGNWKEILLLDISGNKLFGSIPCEIGLLSKLKFLYMHNNHFSKNLPAEVGNLINLINIDFQYNLLDGSIPTEIGKLSRLVDLILNNNELSKSIPFEIGNLTKAVQIFLYNNLLTGSIPSSIGNCTLLFQLVLYNNNLKGTIPIELSSLIRLGILELYNNALSGSVPLEFGNMSNLLYLYLDNNYLSGKLENIQINSSIISLNLGYNKFTGSLPFQLLSKIANSVYFQSNNFDGTLSSVITSYTFLTSLDVSNNKLSGSFDFSIQEMKVLKSLILSENYFLGKLNTLFTYVQSSNYSVNLVTVDVSDNGFSGTLPMELFNSTSLNVFVAAKNCFTGSISASICSALSLNVLDLSGLSAGSACSRAFTYGILDFYTARSVSGGIPSCIYHLPNMTAIFLAGNGIESSLVDLPLDSKLTNLSLSYNRLHGTIPLSIQESSAFEYLDLSFNFLSGTVEYMNYLNFGLNSNYSYSALVVGECNLYLQRNRLSGLLPTYFKYAESINVLSGNIFSCKYKSSLPYQDPGFNNYICGSNTLNNYVYTMLSIVLILIMVLGLLIYGTVRTHYSLNAEVMVLVTTAVRYLLWGLDSATSHVGVQQLALTLSLFRQYCAFITFLIVIIFLPLFVILKYSGFASYTHEYGWIVSMGYLSNFPPAVSITILWIISLCLILLYHKKLFNAYAAARYQQTVMLLPSTTVDHYGIVTTTDLKYKLLIFGSLFIIFNLVVVFVANGAYVVVLLYYSESLQILSTILLVLFKISWNMAVIFPILELLQYKLHTIAVVIIFNNVVIPIFVTMVVDINCFKTLFIAETPFTSSYTVSKYECEHRVYNSTVCPLHPTLYSSVTFTPPFIYSAQCSSSILANYVPIYVLLFGITGLFIPSVQLILMRYFHKHRTSLMYRLKQRMNFFNIISGDIICNMIMPIETVNELNLMLKTNTPLYDIRRLSITYVSYVFLLVTFGLGYPPLAVLLLLSVTLQTLSLQLCVNNHYHQVVNNKELYDVWSKIVAIELRDLYIELSTSSSLSFLLSSLFVGFFVIDMTFNSNQIAVIILPIFMFTSTMLLLILFHYSSTIGQLNIPGNDISMINMNPQPTNTDTCEANANTCEAKEVHSMSTTQECVENPLNSNIFK